MGTGNHNPGEIYVVEVEATHDKLVLTGDKFDPRYFAKGGKFVAIFTPHCEYRVGQDSPSAQSDD